MEDTCIYSPTEVVRKISENMMVQLMYILLQPSFATPYFPLLYVSEALKDLHHIIQLELLKFLHQTNEEGYKLYTRDLVYLLHVVRSPFWGMP